MKRRTSLSEKNQLSLFDSMPEPSIRVVPYYKTDLASTLIRRIEQAARHTPEIAIDLSGDISKVATSAQALDLILVEREILYSINKQRRSDGLPSIQLSYLLPSAPSLRFTPGVFDLARLNIHRYLQHLKPGQVAVLERLSHDTHTAHDILMTDEAVDQEMSEITLVPVEAIEGEPGSVQPLVHTTTQRLTVLLRQGMPGVDDIYIRQITTFVEESASNIRDHAGERGIPCEGFIAANRTYGSYLDHTRNQQVEVYTTHVSCYDLGRGVLAALTSVPQHAATIANSGARTTEEQAAVALNLAIKPGISSKHERGRGGGLPWMINMIRSLADASTTDRFSYQGSLRLVSSSATLDVMTTSQALSHDRYLPGTQVQLRFRTIRRVDL